MTKESAFFVLKHAPKRINLFFGTTRSQYDMLSGLAQFQGHVIRDNLLTRQMNHDIKFKFFHVLLPLFQRRAVVSIATLLPARPLAHGRGVVVHCVTGIPIEWRADRQGAEHQLAMRGKIA